MDKNAMRKKITACTNKQESLVCITTCLVIVAPSIISLFNGVIRLFVTLPFKLDTIFIYGAMLIMVLCSAKTVLDRSSVLVYSIITFLFLGYLISFMINSYYYEYYFKYGIDFLLFSAPWILATYAIRDNKLLKKYLYFSALIILGTFIMKLYVFKTNIFGKSSYDQSYAYTMLPVVIIILNNLFDRIKWIDVAVFITSFILMLSMGARGPLVCVGLYVVLKIILMYKYKRRKAFLISTIILSTIVPVYIYFHNILSYLLSTFQRMNLSTRTISTLMKGNFFVDKARNLLTEYSIGLIREHPLLGVGIGRDRIFLADKMGGAAKVSEAAGWYPHNIFLEILLHFGVFIGGAIIVYMLIIIYTTTFKNMDKDASDVICIFIGIGFFPLLVSGSYITSPLFFALAGFCLYQYKNIRVNKKRINDKLTLFGRVIMWKK